jgi:hypothetical protein
MKTHIFLTVILLTLCFTLVPCIAVEQVILLSGGTFPPPGLQNNTIHSLLAKRAFRALESLDKAETEGRAGHTLCELYGWMVDRDPAQLTVPINAEVRVLTNGTWALMFDNKSSTVWFAKMEWATNRIERLFGPAPVADIIEALEYPLRPTTLQDASITKSPDSGLVMELLIPLPLAITACFLSFFLGRLRQKRIERRDCQEP